MRKKLLAGMLALALCSTNMPPQTIFAGEFTSGNPDIVSEEETPEIFTNEEQETAGGGTLQLEKGDYQLDTDYRGSSHHRPGP